MNANDQREATKEVGIYLFCASGERASERACERARGREKRQLASSSLEMKIKSSLNGSQFRAVYKIDCA